MGTYSFGTSHTEKLKLLFLHHQRSDKADTLQFYSTDEYFKTTEYEHQTPLGVRGILQFRIFRMQSKQQQTHGRELSCRNLANFTNFDRIDHHHEELD